ncbi:serine/threonine-protein kinase [Chloropicon primus]|uniref:Serine/threonine-protein kinase n=2 Tax=Chloropicon primus TaxID=1764295 RepID=A0A5B8N1W7_9CHLO|nr:serine/threonine-protein kinase [Chloropicon primus]UPR04910.1 serine/threonine-protein kinase [Chloropicon primus]|eukprot:QDZ25714.1 serine/threonine-protein kinase [Chloropicon primus]
MLRNHSSTNVASATAKKTYPTSAADYEVLDVVGQGVSAKVFRALCKPLNEIVAVKTIELEGMNSNLEEIMREAKTMRMAQHPNILSLHCSFVTKDNALWMVMPYVGGGSVLSIMKWAYRDGLEESWIASILCEVLKSVAYMHKNKFIHRDIKAGNILIDLDGHVKLGDFGVAATMERSGSWGKGGNTRQTFVGTPCWMAPEVMEQIEGYDWHADIWSFGITMLEMAHGHAPFAKYPPMKVLLMTLQNEPPKLEESYKQRHFSKAMREVVQLCLQKDPKRRPTAAKLLEHRLFKNAHHDKEFLVKHLLKGLPSLVERVHNLSNTVQKSMKTNNGGAGEGDKDVSRFAAQQEMETKSQDAYVKGVSAWDFDVSALKMDAANEPSGEDSKATEKKLGLNVQAPGGSLGGPVQVTSPLSIKQKTPAAHKGRFKINLEDDDESLMNSPPTSGNNMLTRRLSQKILDTKPLAQATQPVAKENVKKEQRGRFFISGENEDERDDVQDLDELKAPKKQQDMSSSQHAQSSAATKLDQAASESSGKPASAAKAKDGSQARGGAGPEASVSPQVVQYLQGMQASLQQQQDTLSYLLGSGGSLKLGGQKGAALQSPRPHSLHESGQHHAQLLKSLDEMTLSIRGLCEENDKLKKRNLHLERELTKCQNKLLELQEAKEEEEEEQQMKQIERVSSQVINDRDNARHLASANRSLSDKSLTGGS